jgi:hypothetical protein
VKRIKYDGGIPTEDGGFKKTKLRCWIVRGPKGAVDLLLDWLPYDSNIMGSLGQTPDGYYPSDLGYHKATRGEGKRDEYRSFNSWCFVTGGKCSYDGTTMGAMGLYSGLLTHGEEWLWTELEKLYEEAL